MLELPPTIRIPRQDEIPDNIEVKELVVQSHAAKIIEGYKLLPNQTHELPFNFYATININNSQLWNLFLSLADILPDNVAVIFNYRDAEPVYGNYMAKADVINVLSGYKLEIAQDGFFELGVIHNTADKLEEVFINHAKYIQFWGLNETSFRKVMHKFSLEEIHDLRFIDEFPKVVESLEFQNSKAKSTNTVFQEFQNTFTTIKKKPWWKF